LAKHTPRVKRILKNAEAEADRFGHPYLGTEHLLLALLAEKDGIAKQVLMALANEEVIRASTYSLMFPPSPPGFEHHPGPWTSVVLLDEAGSPIWKGPRSLRQYFVDRNGEPVRGTLGRLVHFAMDENGRLILDSDRRPVLIELPDA
jgi:hypothetical protein